MGLYTVASKTFGFLREQEIRIATSPCRGASTRTMTKEESATYESPQLQLSLPQCTLSLNLGPSSSSTLAMAGMLKRTRHSRKPRQRATHASTRSESGAQDKYLPQEAYLMLRREKFTTAWNTTPAHS